MEKQVKTGLSKVPNISRQTQENVQQPFFEAFGHVQPEAPKKTVFFQPKLSINEAGDRYEQEADAMAEKVVRMPSASTLAHDGTVQAKPLQKSSLQRKCVDCVEEEKERVQRKETGELSGANTAPSVVAGFLSSNTGQPMADSPRQFMESRFWQDFGDVRIHTGVQAAESAAAIQARAYTSGKDIVFGAGEYQPENEDGKKLLAHELTHVGQQHRGETRSIQRKPGDVNVEILAPFGGVDDSISYLDFNYEKTAGTFGDFEQVFVVQGNKATFYRITRTAKGFKKELLATYSIKQIDFPPAFLLAMPDGKFGVLATTEKELANNVTEVVDGLVGGTKDTPEQLKLFKELDKVLTMSNWFLNTKDFADFNGRLKNTGFAVIIMPTRNGSSGGQGVGESAGKPPKPKWMDAYQEAMKKLIKEQKIKEPEAKDLPNNFYFYYSKDNKKYRAAAPGKDEEGKKELKAFLDVEEKIPYAETLELIRTKLRIKQLAEFQITHQHEDEDSRKGLKDEELWVYKLLLQLRKRIKEDRNGRPDRYDLPEAVSLARYEDQPGYHFLSISVRLPATYKLPAADDIVAANSAVPNTIELKTTTLGDPLRKEMSLDSIFQMVRTVTVQLKEGLGQVAPTTPTDTPVEPAPSLKSLDPNKEQKKYKKIRAAYPAEIIALDTRPDFIAVTGGKGRYRMKIDFGRFEGQQLLNLTLANMQTIYYRWITLPLADVLSPEELKAVGAISDWTERREQLVRLFSTKTMRQDASVYLKGGWDWDAVGSSSVPKAEGDYVVYGQAFFKPGDDVFRVPSEAFYPIHAVDGKRLALETLNAPEANLEALQNALEYARANDLKDKAIELEASIQSLQENLGSSMLDNTQRSLDEMEKLLRHAKIIKNKLKEAGVEGIVAALATETENGEKIGPELIKLWGLMIKSDRRADIPQMYKVNWAIHQFEQQRDNLIGIKSRAGDFNGDIKGTVYSPRTVFISKVTGSEYQLLTILAEAEDNAEEYFKFGEGGQLERLPNRTVMLLIDVTTKETKRKYIGTSDNPDKTEAKKEATINAYKKFGEKAVYGEGYVRFKVPKIPGLAQSTIDINSSPSTWEKTKKVLAIVATLVGTVALVVGTFGTGTPAAIALGAGLAAGAVGAGLSIGNIMDRVENHNFSLDVDFALDVLNIVGFFASVSKLAAASKITSEAKMAKSLVEVERAAAALVRLEKGFMVYQKIETTFNIVLTADKTAEDLVAIDNLEVDDDTKASLRRAIMGNALLAGTMLAISVRQNATPIASKQEQFNNLLKIRANYQEYRNLNREMGLIDKDGNLTLPTKAAPESTHTTPQDAIPAPTGKPSPAAAPETVNPPAASGGGKGGGKKPPSSSGGSGGKRPKPPKLDAESQKAVQELDAKIADLQRRVEANDTGAKFYIETLQAAKNDILRNPGPETVANARESLVDLEISYPTGKIAEGLDSLFSKQRKKIVADDSKTILEFLATARTWKEAVRFLQSKGKNGIAPLESIQRFRERVVADLSQRYGAAELGQASKFSESDKDLNFPGENAGANLLKAEVDMHQAYGDDWSEILRMNFYTDGERLTMFQRETSSLSQTARATLEIEITTLANRFSLAKMLRHAKGNVKSEQRVEKIIGSVAPHELASIRLLADIPATQQQARRTALHHEVDTLLKSYHNSDTPEASRPSIAAEITKKQIEINYLTTEAYIAPSALHGVTAPIKGKLSFEESRAAVLSQLEQMEHIIQQSDGDVVKAAREYELYKYMGRGSEQMQHEQTDLFFDGLNKSIAKANRDGPKSWTSEQIQQHYDDFMKYVEKFLQQPKNGTTPPGPGGAASPPPGGVHREPHSPLGAFESKQLPLPYSRQVPAEPHTALPVREQTPLTAEEMFRIIVTERAFTFSRGGGEAPQVDPAGLGKGVGPDAGGRKAGFAVFAIIQVTNRQGKVLAQSRGEYVQHLTKIFGTEHAEPRATRALEQSLVDYSPEELKGGKMLVVLDQFPCGPDSANCGLNLLNFANKYGIELDVRVPVRESLTGKGDVSPRTATRGAQRVDTPPVRLIPFEIGSAGSDDQ